MIVCNFYAGRFLWLQVIICGQPKLIKPVHTVAEKCDNLSQKSATVAEFRRCLAVFGDSRTFPVDVRTGHSNTSIVLRVTIKLYACVLIAG